MDIENKKKQGFYAVLLLVVLFFHSCKEAVSVNGLPTITQTKNPTVKKLQFSLSDSALVTIRLQNLKRHKEQYLVSTKSKAHELLLAGLKPNETYALQILDGEKEIAVIDSFRTAPIEENIVSVYERVNTKKAFDGYVLTQRRLVKGSVYMLDNESDLVWYQMVDGQPKLSRWTKDNEVLVLVGNARHNNSAGNRIVSYTIDGDITYQIDLSALGFVAHHEVLEHEDDVFTIVYDTIPNKVNGQLEKAVSSAVVRLNKEGEVLWKWSTFDIKNPVGISFEDMDGDWGHANALAFDDDGNLLISYRDWSQIWKIDIKTGKRIWVLGEEGDFQLEDLPFNSQHAIHKDPKGNYMLFNNGRKQRQTSVVSYKLEDNKAQTVVSINLPDDLYADKMGNVETLPNGNYLVCSPRSRSILVLSPSGEISYHINTGIPDPYRATFVPSFYIKN
ncbi:aryl-sulfate sulfotransferase [Aestuariivivens insulae]|uniref:aryl-sulfate sulfotransferase n=1 Tax=Aestuariivivens insulae TaxID=1621988 RepID=UPI001F584384|nr:aryl-sulfate sulfotransferase [Aestuariivivens insulae]